MGNILIRKNIFGCCKTYINYLLLLGILALCTNCGRPNPKSREPERDNKSVDTNSQIVSGNIPAPKPMKMRPVDSVNFYLENSASMYGYLKGGTEFKTALNKLLYDLELITPNQQSDHFRFFYINDQAHPTTRNLQAFLQNLSQQGIHIGNTTTSDLNLIFETVLEQSNSENLGIMVTDAIFDLNGRPEEAISQLEQAVSRTRNIFVRKLKQNPVETVVIKLGSQFNGTYYPFDHKPKEITQQRPYYIWLFFGQRSIIRQAKDTINTKHLPGYMNEAHFFVMDDAAIPYTIINSGKIGSFKYDKHNKLHTVLDDCERQSRGSNQGSFGFNLAVDYSCLPLADDYFCNTQNYTLNEGWKIREVIPVQKYDFTANDEYHLKKIGQKPTHIIKVEINNLTTEVLNIYLKRMPFDWIEETGTTNDNPPDTISTFAFNTLMRSVVEAYDNVNGHSNYAHFTININK